jgi:UDP-N-acetylmuramoyl-tripeptide--D-alanyl-D-alanine ligase
MLWTAAAVASATAGRPLEPIGDDRPSWTSVSIDSRQVAPGALFVPVRAERDGHDFIADALARGATGYLVEAGHSVLGSGRIDRPVRIDLLGSVGDHDQAAVEGRSAGRPFVGRPFAGRPFVGRIEVADTGVALLDLGRAARRRLAGPAIGITGSVGKTSTKDFLAMALARRWRVTANVKSFNNELGVPLTLANAEADTEVTVIEMGARGAGHIALLCDVARPSVGVVTAVAAVHTEEFGSIEAVASAKGELVEALPANGTAVLNADDHRVAAMAGRSQAAVLTYSADGRINADVIATDVQVSDDLRATFLLSSPWGSGRVTLAARGAHQVGNALAAAAAALRCDVDINEVVAALGLAVVSPWRMELHRTPAGAVIVNDAYNANPASMAAALRSLGSIPAQRRIAVVGEMAELGAFAALEHRAIAELAAALGVKLIAFGTERYDVEPVADLQAALEAVGPLGAGDAVLVKASRVVGLERLVPLLIG